MTHTPLPWTLHPKTKFVVMAGNRSTCSTGGHSDNQRDPVELELENKGNAAFIVTACNAHYYLIEALELAVKSLKRAPLGTFQAAERALKKAKGEN